MGAMNRRREWLSARVGVKNLALQLGLAAAAGHCQVVKERGGRPWLEVEDNGRRLWYPCSLAHKDGLAACCLAASEQVAVGIDLERVNEKPWRLRRHFVTKHDSLAEDLEKTQRCTLLWACKEAASKVMGCGMRMDFTLLQVRGGEDRRVSVSCDGAGAIRGTYGFVDGLVLVCLLSRREEASSRCEEG